MKVLMAGEIGGLAKELWLVGTVGPGNVQSCTAGTGNHCDKCMLRFRVHC